MKQMKTYQIGLAIALVVISMVCGPEALVGAGLTNARIGIITPGLGLMPVHEAMEEGLDRLGYTEGKNATFLVEDTNGSTADLTSRAAKLIALKLDLLFAVTNSHALAAKQATSTVPVVFAWVGDPLGAGLVPGFPYSKSNLTGVTASGDSLSGKRLEVLLEIAPKTKRVLVIVSAQESVAVSSFRAMEEPAKKLGMQLVRRDITSAEDIKKTLEETPKGSIDAIFHVPSNLVRVNIDLLIKKSKVDRIPLSVHEDSLVDRGALISYGPYSRLVGLQSANLVNKILKGGRPGEIKVETPDRLFLAINQTTAKQIGMNISRALLERADRLIQ